MYLTKILMIYNLLMVFGLLFKEECLAHLAHVVVALEAFWFSLEP